MSTYRIKGADGVVIESNLYLELPKAKTKQTPDVKRPGMIRYNDEWKAFEGTLELTDKSVVYRRFANLDDNGKLLTSQLPDVVTSGMQYVGTFSPLTDDIDPPVVAGQYDKLPVPSSSNTGQYYIVRGIYDIAMQHYNANKPTTDFVIFTPVNPSGAGNWIEIKYYVGIDPVNYNNSVNKIVVSAFARIIKTAIPSTGHEGLVSLAADDVLTAPFTQDNNASQEKALTDGDWIISSDTKWQRLRDTRIGINATQVGFDRTFMYANHRLLQDAQSGTVQTVLDSLIINGLRRTGDSMFDNGGEGSGRLALVYGTAAAPALTFNNKSFDPIANPGMDTTKWSDSNTGLFHPADGHIGFTSNGIERLRIAPQTLTISQFESTNIISNPTITLVGSSNTNNMGISALNNTFSFVSKNKLQVEFKDSENIFYGTGKFTGLITGNNGLVITAGGATITGLITGNNGLLIAAGGATITGDIHGKNNLIIDGNETITGNSTITGTSTINGNLTANGDSIVLGKTDKTGTLTVNSTATFLSPVSLNGTLNVAGNVVIGTNASNTLVVNSTSTFVAPVSLNSNLTVAGISTLNGNTIIGNASSDTLTVNANSILNGTLVANAASTFNNTVVMNNAVTIGNASSDALTINSTSTINAPSTYNSTLAVKGDITLSNNANINFGNGSNQYFSGGNGGNASNTTTEGRFWLDYNGFSFAENNAEIAAFDFQFYNTTLGDLPTSFSITKYGISIPSLSPINNSKGDNGMLAYSPDLKTAVQKIDGKWKPIGTTTSISQSFANANWVLNGSTYTITVPNNESKNVLSVTVYEGSGSNYSVVDVDTVSITANTIVLSVPSNPDLRFVGKVEVVMSY